MIVILCEDSSSGKYFWKAFQREILRKFDIETILLQAKYKNPNSNSRGSGHGGITKLNYTLIENINKGIVKGNDTLFVTMDMKDNGALTELDKLKVTANKYNLHLIYTQYACFEELILSFTGLIDWCQMKHSDNLMSIYIKTLNYIDSPDGSLECANGCKPNEYIQVENMINNRYRIDNLPQFYSAVLGLMTTDSNVNVHTGCKYNPHFKITKSHLGECWTNDCPEKDVQKNSKYTYCNMCQCDFLMTPLQAETKVLKVLTESVSCSECFNIFKLIMTAYKEKYLIE